MESPGPRFSAPRRVATAPVGLRPSQHAPSSSTQGGVETLYNHPNVKITTFTASARPIPSSHSLPGTTPDGDQGTLSWSSQLERTIAVGTFRIYRAPGSVAFLNCGSALQPILPKSQCWCISEDSSKFVLQIRKPQYWRIELPIVDSEDIQRALLLKETFDQILLFEKTRCPFQRSFTVELPEPPKRPVQKRPWTPVRRSLVPAPPTDSPEASPTLKSSRSFATSPLGADHSPSTAQPFHTANTPDGDGAASAEARHSETPKTTEPGRGPEATDSATVDEIPAHIIASVTTEADTPDSDNASRGKLEAPRSDRVEDGVGDDVKQASGAPQESLARVEDEVGDVEQASEGPQESLPRVETPVKVKEVVLVIEERITEDPTPLTAVNEAITQAQQQAAVLSPTISARSVSSGSRNISPFPAAMMAATSANSKVSTRVSADKPWEHGGTMIAELGGMESLRREDATRHASSPLQEEGVQGRAEEIVQEEPLTSGDVTGEVHEGSGQGANNSRKRKLRRYGAFAPGRPAAVPLQLTVVTSPSAQPDEKHGSPVDAEPDFSNADPERPGDASPTESSDSFHSVEAWQSPVTPPSTSGLDSPDGDRPPQTFPYPHDNIFMPDHASHHRDISDLTVTPDTRCTWDAMSTSSSGVSQLSAITAPDQGLTPIDECHRSHASEDGACYTTATTAKTALRHRSTASIATNRALSPLPPAAELFSPKPRAMATAAATATAAAAKKRTSGRTPMEVLKRVPMAIVSKTCEVLLGPPAYLVQLMLRVASRISAGEWRGLAFGLGEGGEKIPVRWDYSDGDLSGWSDEEVDSIKPPLGCEVVRGGGAGGRRDGDCSDEDDSGRSWGVD